MKKFYLLLLVLPLLAQGQTAFHDLGFVRDTSIAVFHGTQRLQNAWAGGINSAHFNVMDLNFNGKKDLVVFDKNTQKVKTFLNTGSPGVPGYIYAPEYEKYFPEIMGWMQLVDYNNDGKEDLFTYVPGGISVYKNMSNPTDGIKFQLAYYMLLSTYGVGSAPTNILLTEDDYPVIADIDGDGDIDLLVFYGLGSYLHYHQNISTDIQQLAFKLKSPCWGRFAESEDNNQIFLNTCMFWKDVDPFAVAKHTGATKLLLDMDSSGTLDLVLGDADFHNLLTLYNGNTNDSAVISHFDSVFPAGTQPVYMETFPVPCYLDVDNDGVKDLLVGSFESTSFKSNNTDVVWYYRNIGSNIKPRFQFVQKDFLQNQMIDAGSASLPVLYDYDGDGLLDLFIGNYGKRDTSYYVWGSLVSKYASYITLYKNTGTLSQPEFTFVTDDFAGLKSMKLEFANPTFGDLDGDGKADMLIGEVTGRILRFSNTAAIGAPMNMVLVDSNFMFLSDKTNLTPTLYDLDGDSLLDLVVGHRIRQWVDSIGQLTTRGAISYYRNTGTATNPQFTLMTDSLGGVNVTDNYMNVFWGYSAPCFFTDSIGDLKLLVGSNTGKLFYYSNITNNLAGVFKTDTSLICPNYNGDLLSVMFHMVNDSTPEFIDVGRRSAPAVADLTGDGHPDLIVGNIAGGLTFFRGISPPPRTVGIEKSYTTFTNYNLVVFPNPASGEVSIMLPEQTPGSKAVIRLYDLSGRMLRQINSDFNTIYTLNIQELSNGVYILNAEIETGGGIAGKGNTKLIVRNN